MKRIALATRGIATATLTVAPRAIIAAAKRKRC